nr:hypothetical protein GCM10020092_074710 [Actinoplanes digitatis]
MSAERPQATHALKRLLGVVLSGIMVIGGTVLITPAPAYAWGAWAEVPGGGLTVDAPSGGRRHRRGVRPGHGQ